jgi:hypothetical protein
VRRGEPCPSSELTAFVNQRQSIEGFEKASKWTKFQNEFRTDTSWIIFKPSMSTIVNEAVPTSPGASPTATEFRVLAGHAGAVLKAGNSSHAFQQAFHDELRDEWVLADTIPQCITGMQQVFQKYVWNGEDPIPASPPLHPLLTDSLGRSFATKLPAIMRDQAQHYRQILKLFLRMQSRYS